jgi:hypothetical protein
MALRIGTTPETARKSKSIRATSPPADEPQISFGGWNFRVPIGLHRGAGDTCGAP